jgi:molecular chaperone DnaK (HSP70)
MGDQERSPDDTAWLRLLKIAEKIKIDLSVNQETQAVWLDAKDRAHALRLSQTELAEILEQQQFLEQVREAIDEVLSMGLNRGVSKAAIEQILLVGGSCQLVAVQQLIASYFGKVKVQVGKPFEAVAHGALVLHQAIAIADHLRHSYAIRLWEPYLQQYAFYPIFAKGTQYPCQSQEPLILQAAIAGQAEIWLDIGEVADIAQAEVSYDQQGRMISSQLVKKSDFRSLLPSDRIDQGKNQEKYQGKDQEKYQVCIAKLEPLGQIGSDRIAVNFAIDQRRILIATVRDLLTDKILIAQQAIAKLE